MNNDQVSSGVFFIIGLAICLKSISYELGSFSSPGSGFAPFLIGAGISFFSGLGFIEATMKKKKGERWTSLMKGLHWERSFIILASLMAYALLLIPLGFFLCTSLLIGFLLKVIVPQRWPVVIGMALLAAIASYFVFAIWLQAQLPKGHFWGIIYGYF